MLDSDTTVRTFTSMVSLPSGQYTVIAHVRWYSTDGIKHDVARATVRDVTDPKDDTALYVSAILGSLLGFGLIGGGGYITRRVYQVLLHSRTPARMQCSPHVPRAWLLMVRVARMRGSGLRSWWPRNRSILRSARRGVSRLRTKRRTSWFFQCVLYGLLTSKGDDDTLRPLQATRNGSPTRHAKPAACSAVPGPPSYVTNAPRTHRTSRRTQRAQRAKRAPRAPHNPQLPEDPNP